MVIKPGKHQRSRHTCQDLCRWKVHYSAQSFVLRAYAIHELRNQHVSLRSWRYCKFKRRSCEENRERDFKIPPFSRLRRSLLAAPPPKLYFARALPPATSLPTRYLFISRGHSRFSFTSRATDQAKEGPLVICHSY